MKRYVAESFSRLFAGCNFFFLSLGNSLYREQFFQSRDDFEKTWNYREKFISKSAVLFDWKRVLSYQILLREKEREDRTRNEAREEKSMGIVTILTSSFNRFPKIHNGKHFFDYPARKW